MFFIELLPAYVTSIKYINIQLHEHEVKLTQVAD